MINIKIINPIKLIKGYIKKLLFKMTNNIVQLKSCKFF